MQSMLKYSPCFCGDMGASLLMMQEFSKYVSLPNKKLEGGCTSGAEERATQVQT